MGERYQQFLGSEPGIVVELIDDSTSPYLVRTLDGFAFHIAADDFRTYYRREGSRTPKRWAPLVSDPANGTVDSRKMAEVMAVIRPFQDAFKDFGKARAFVREALATAGDDPRQSVAERLSSLAKESGATPEALDDRWIERLLSIPDAVKALLLSESCAEFQLPTGGDEEESPSAPNGPESADSASPAKKAQRKTPAKVRKERMKNVEMLVEGDLLTITVDMSQEFGPSKSGKTTIVASTEGNKSVPGREEKIGLNIYKQETAKPATGRRNSFKNVEMALNGAILTIKTDLSQEYGPSKSGKTIIIASTEGNQLVYGRGEKIGLNVYRKIE